MVVKNLFGKVNYPQDINQREIIVKEYNSKMNNLINRELPEKKFKMSLLFLIINLLCIASIFVLGDISIIIKMLYIVPAISFSIYDFLLLCKVKREGYKNEKRKYKKDISQLCGFILLMYMGTYLLEIKLFNDEITIKIALLSWVIFIILSIGSFLKAIKNAPDKFLNKYLNPNNKYKEQPSWMLNITKILIVLVCSFKPYLLIMALIYIIISPLIYVVVYSYYTYLQYEEIQNLLG